MISPRTLLLLLLLPPVAGAQTAPIYKWLDQHGQVHYGQQPPPGSRAETVSVNGGRSNGALLEDLRTRSAAADREREGAQEAAAEAEARAEAERARAQACTQMRANLEVLQTRNRVRELRDGEYVTLDAEERKQRLEELHGQLAEHCPD